MSANFPFADGDLRAVLEGRERRMAQEIEAIDAERLLNTSLDDWGAYLVDEYTVDVPLLGEQGITVAQRETRIDVSGDAAVRSSTGPVRSMCLVPP